MKNFFLALALLSAIVSGCSNADPDSNSQLPGTNNPPAGGTSVSLTPITQNSVQWLLGDWQLNRAPMSYGDLGSDPQYFHITTTDFWVEKFGHLASENYWFNTNGYDYGGNCRYRIHSNLFGIDGKQLVYFPSSYELIADGGNRNDCDQQIQRINAVMSDTQEKGVGNPTSVDGAHFDLLSPDDTLQFDDEKFSYERR